MLDESTPERRQNLISGYGLRKKMKQICVVHDLRKV